MRIGGEDELQGITGLTETDNTGVKGRRVLACLVAGASNRDYLARAFGQDGWMGARNRVENSTSILCDCVENAHG